MFMPLWSSIKHALIMRDRAIFRAVSIIDSLLKDSLFIVVINFLRQAALDSHRVKNGSADISLLAFFRINGKFCVQFGHCLQRYRRALHHLPVEISEYPTFIWNWRGSIPLRLSWSVTERQHFDKISSSSLLFSFIPLRKKIKLELVDSLHTRIVLIRFSGENWKYTKLRIPFFIRYNILSRNFTIFV